MMRVCVCMYSMYAPLHSKGHMESWTHVTLFVHIQHSQLVRTCVEQEREWVADLRRSDLVITTICKDTVHIHGSLGVCACHQPRAGPEDTCNTANAARSGLMLIDVPYTVLNTLCAHCKYYLRGLRSRPVTRAEWSWAPGRKRPYLGLLNPYSMFKTPKSDYHRTAALALPSALPKRANATIDQVYTSASVKRRRSNAAAPIPSSLRMPFECTHDMACNPATHARSHHSAATRAHPSPPHPAQQTNATSPQRQTHGCAYGAGA